MAVKMEEFTVGMYRLITLAVEEGEDDDLMLGVIIVFDESYYGVLVPVEGGYVYYYDLLNPRSPINNWHGIELGEALRRARLELRGGNSGHWRDADIERLFAFLDPNGVVEDEPISDMLRDELPVEDHPFPLPIVEYEGCPATPEATVALEVAAVELGLGHDPLLDAGDIFEKAAEAVRKEAVATDQLLWSSSRSTARSRSRS